MIENKTLKQQIQERIEQILHGKVTLLELHELSSHLAEIEIEKRKEWLEKKKQEHLRKTSIIDHFQIVDELLEELH